MTFDQIPCKVIRSDRRSFALEIRSADEIVIRVPRRATEAEISKVLEQKSSWLRSALTKAADRRPSPSAPLSPEEMKQLVIEAKALIPDRVRYHARRMGLSYGRITLRSQRTRWGSCSRQGNLNFNVLLMLAPREVLDSVIVHELCHLIHLDHSKAFWAEVYRWFPDYDACHNWLKNNGSSLLSRLPNE